MTQTLTIAQRVGPVATSRVETRENLKKAADAFEAIFTGMMMKSMRQASLGEAMLDSDATKTFRDMQDGEMARSISVGGNLGISKALQQFLTRNRPDLATADMPHE
jgi:peptidoglycan hydrolase FlgJ